MATEIGIEGLLVGHYTDRDGCTGCTVIILPPGSRASADIRGGGPSTRETSLLSPYSTVGDMNALFLTGGSAFGLAAADGVVRYLEEKGLGHLTTYARGPLVAGAVIYDLGLGCQARPRPEHGYRAAAAATAIVEEGSVGVGTGATVGKVLFENGWMKGGFAACSMKLPGDVTIAALTVVNAFGDVLAEDGSILAGARDGHGFVDTSRYLLTVNDHPQFSKGADDAYRAMFNGGTLALETDPLSFPTTSGDLPSSMPHSGGDAHSETRRLPAWRIGWRNTGSQRGVLPGGGSPLGGPAGDVGNPTTGNTTLSVVVTDARLDKIRCAQVARVAHDGLARAIRPVHTPADGDAVFVISAGDRTSNLFQIGCAASEVVATSIRRAVRLAEGLGGAPAVADLAREAARETTRETAREAQPDRPIGAHE